MPALRGAAGALLLLLLQVARLPLAHGSPSDERRDEVSELLVDSEEELEEELSARARPAATGSAGGPSLEEELDFDFPPSVSPAGTAARRDAANIAVVSDSTALQSVPKAKA